MLTPIVTLTGVQPTGDVHLGNYASAIRPLAQLAADPAREVYAFVADLHALNSRPTRPRCASAPAGSSRCCSRARSCVRARQANCSARVPAPIKN